MSHGQGERHLAVVALSVTLASLPGPPSACSPRAAAAWCLLCTVRSAPTSQSPPTLQDVLQPTLPGAAGPSHPPRCSRAGPGHREVPEEPGRKNPTTVGPSLELALHQSCCVMITAHMTVPTTDGKSSGVPAVSRAQQRH